MGLSFSIVKVLPLLKTGIFPVIDGLTAIVGVSLQYDQLACNMTKTRLTAIVGVSLQYDQLACNMTKTWLTAIVGVSLQYGPGRGGGGSSSDPGGGLKTGLTPIVGVSCTRAIWYLFRISFLKVSFWGVAAFFRWVSHSP